MKVTLLAAILLASLLAVGCGTEKNAVKPAAEISTVHVVGQAWTDANGTKWEWLDSVHLQSVTIGKVRVVYVCDWNGIGPPAPGHCFTDGTGCVDPVLQEP